MTTEVPLIHTAKGNLPIADLTFEPRWRVADDLIAFEGIYRDAAGEVVRQDAYVYIPQLSATSEA